MSQTHCSSDIANVPSIDLVNWTQMVELKFYLLMAVLAFAIRRGSLIAVFAAACVILGVSRYSHEIFAVIRGLGLALRVFETNALYVLYMLIGVIFSYHIRGRVSTPVAVASVSVLFAMFVACWPLTFFRAEYPSVTLNYAWALLLFSAAYCARRIFPDLRGADFFADVSYPLYLVHAIVGFSILNVLIGAHVDTLPAALVAFAVALALALGVHVTIEGRSQAFGKAFAARLFGRLAED